MRKVASKTNKEDFFFIEYKSLVPESKALSDLSLFLDTNYDKEKLRMAISTQHSYFNPDKLTEEQRMKIHELEMLKTENTKG